MDRPVPLEDGSFAAFVAARRPALLRTALLLTGDPVSAEALVQRTLTAGRRRWARLTAAGDPGPAVLAALVAGATSRRASWTRTEQVLESWSPEVGRPDGDPARVLRELPPVTRAAVVLRWYEGLDDDAAARLLGRPADEVRAAAREGVTRLAAALPGTGYERDPGSRDDGDRVRDLLFRLATPAGPWQLDGPAAVADVGARRRSTRRRVAGGLLAAACVAGVAVPLARALPAPVPSATAPAVRETAQPPPIAPRSAPVLVGPARGSLAGDADFLDAVRRAGWGPQVAPPVEQRDVVLATDTPAGRVALVTGTVDEDFRGVWLTGPVGAAPDQLAVHVPPRLGRDRPLSLVLGGPGPATLVVVAGTDDRIEVSDRLQIGPRGTVNRTYEMADAPDGVAVMPIRTTTRGTGASIRVTTDGRVVHRSPADWPGADPGRPVPLPAGPPLRPVGALPDDRLLAVALTGLAVPLAVEPEALEAQLVWSGALPGGVPGTVAVVLGRSPGGGLLVSTWARVAGAAVLCGVSTPPGAADVAGLTVARVCDVTSSTADPSASGRWLVVSAPPAGATAEVLDGRDRLVETVPLAGGGAVAVLPEDARTVRVLDAAGAAVGAAPVSPMATELFGDYGPGPAR